MTPARDDIVVAQERGGITLADAARLVVDQRMRSVADGLERLREEMAHSGEGVHQLRVATRRASAALLVFQPFLDEAAWSKARKRLRRMRRAAGEARACDVQLGLLNSAKEDAPETQREALEYLVRKIRRSRWRARRRIIRVLDRFPTSRVRRWRKGLGRAFRSGAAIALPVVASNEQAGGTADSCTLIGVARLLLERVLSPLAQAAQPLPRGPEDLHELRLAAKRLRYACELFRRCFEPDQWKRAQAQTVSLQDRLGEINDLSDMAELVDKTIGVRAAKQGTDPSDEMVQGLRLVRHRFLQKRDTQADEFREWWDGGGRESLLEAYRSLLNPNETARPMSMSRNGSVASRPAMALNGDNRPCA